MFRLEHKSRRSQVPDTLSRLEVRILIGHHITLIFINLNHSLIFMLKLEFSIHL